MGKKVIAAILIFMIGIVVGFDISILIEGKQHKNQLFPIMLQIEEQILNSQSAIEQRLEALEKQGKARPLSPPQAPAEDSLKVYSIDVAHSFVLGKKDAPVTITEFVDFQCPFCARFHPVVVEVLKAYPDKVNAVLKNFPLSFHQQAIPAAKAAFAAGKQGKYWEMAESLLKNNTNLTDKRFLELAKDIGINADKFQKDYQDMDATWQEYIQKDIALGNSIGVNATPTMFLNGRKTRSRDVESFKKEIEQILNAKK